MQSLTPDELDHLLAVAKEADKQDHLILRISYECFLRVSEVLRLRAGDMLPDGRVVCRRLKGSKTNCLPLSPETKQLVEWLLTYRPNAGDLLFNRARRTLDTRIKKYCAQAGIPPAKAHHHAVAKHSACQHAIDSTGNLLAVQALAGHADVGSTLQYVKMTVDDAVQIAQGRASGEGE